MAAEYPLSWQKPEVPPDLPTGESFYGNFPLEGIFEEGKHISAQQYVEELREKFPSVQVRRRAVDSLGRRIKADFAIYVS